MGLELAFRLCQLGEVLRIAAHLRVQGRVVGFGARGVSDPAKTDHFTSMTPASCGKSSLHHTDSVTDDPNQVDKHTYLSVDGLPEVITVRQRSHGNVVVQFAATTEYNVHIPGIMNKHGFTWDSRLGTYVRVWAEEGASLESLIRTRAVWPQYQPKNHFTGVAFLKPRFVNEKQIRNRMLSVIRKAGFRFCMIKKEYRMNMTPEAHRSLSSLNSDKQTEISDITQRRYAMDPKSMFKEYKRKQEDTSRLIDNIMLNSAFSFDKAWVGMPCASRSETTDELRAHAWAIHGLEPPAPPWIRTDVYGNQI
jgi:hypothetical protein